jgi:pyocin large subunit-like protein
MRRLPGWLLPLAVFVTVFAAVFELGGPPQTISAPPATAVVWSHGADGALANAEEHWLKHGGDFPELHSAQDYERAALAFMRHPPPGTLIKHRADGDTLFFEPATDNFAVADAQGAPRTFFRPRRGREYWDRQ